VPTVALFVTCVVDGVTPEVGIDAARLLEHAGCTVVVPPPQTCCGQPALTAGHPEAAARLARHWVEVFEPHDAIVAPSGSCVATVRHWYPRIVGDDWRARAERVAARTHELTGYLVDVLGRTDLGLAIHATATVHDACHGLRGLGAGPAVRQLLAGAGVDVVEMHDPEACCGFGGSFGVRHGVVAGPMADRKLDDAASTRTDHLVAGDGGCLLHLEGRRRRRGDGSAGPVPTHVASLLAQGLPSAVATDRPS
jgi:L-lactate dehydrogenase complex protein LldE